MSGRLIVLEGLDGCGKATQTKLLCQALEARGIPVCHISFPDYGQPSSSLVKLYLNGAFGKNPNDVNPYAAASFYTVDRFASYQQFWKAAYLAGQTIIADRYTTSNLIYQLPKLPRAEWEAFGAWLFDFEYQKCGLPQPDLTFYLDMPPAASRKLMEKRYAGDTSREDIHEQNAAYQAACREAALYAARRFDWQVIACAQGEQVRSPVSIHQEILQKYDACCPQRV